MRAVVVHESIYGNTHTVADHIAAGLRPTFDVTVVPVGEATRELVSEADLLVVGGPTHAHGMTRRGTRRSGVDAGLKSDDLSVDPDAEGLGLRDWLRPIEVRAGMAAAAFDTRFDMLSAFTGRASRGIARRLRHHHCHLAMPPESFLVDKKQHLLASEAARATEWGATLAAVVSAEMPTPAG